MPMKLFQRRLKWHGLLCKRKNNALTVGTICAGYFWSLNVTIVAVDAFSFICSGDCRSDRYLGYRLLWFLTATLSPALLDGLAL
jgi:hypothetical protein